MREHGDVHASPRRLAVAGAVTGLAGVAASDVTTSVLSQQATPVQAMAEVVIDHTPGAVVEALVGLVGRHDKPLLAAGIVVVVVLLGAVAGLLAGRRVLLGHLVFWLVAAVALVVVLTRPGSSQFAVLPVAVAVLVWTVVLDWLVRVARVPSEPAPEQERASRRRFLVTAGGVAVGAVVLGTAGRVVGRTRRAVEASRALLRLPVSRGRVPAGAELGLAGATPWRVSGRDFYRIDTAVVVPAVDPAEWRLRIHGLVDRELTLTYRQLLDRSLTEAWVTLCCVSNEVGGDLIGNAWWSGVRVADLLREAGVQDGADAVKQTSHDGWTCGTPLSALTDDRVAMLAVAMNGEPLPVEHGFPVRMVVPGLYGYVSATKWVTDLEVTRYDDFSAFWTDRGWSAKGPVKTESRIEVPRGGADVTAGSVRVGGQAWAQHTGIAKVEYRLDGDAWREAELGRVPGADTWVQWAGTVQVDPGKHTLAVRATDRGGYTQTAARADVVPNGATGWHTVDFRAQG